MHALMELLADALRYHGYTVTPKAALEGQTGTVYTIPLLAEHDERAYLIDGHLEGLVPAEILAQLEDVGRDVGADGCVLAHLEPMEAHATSVVTWGRDDLVRLLGEAALARVTTSGAAAPTFDVPDAATQGPVAESLDELLPPAFHSEPEHEFNLMDLEALGDEPLTADSSDFFEELDALVEGPETPAPMAAIDSTGNLQFPMLPLRCTPKEAAHAVRERLFQASHVQMILHPVYLFDYECDLLSEGSLRYDTVAGRIQVHGTHKDVLEVEPEAVDPAGFGQPAPEGVQTEEKALRIDDDRAKQLSRDFLVATHTRLVDVQIDDDDNGFAYTEKRKVAPRPDHIRLAALGVFYRATWRVFGPNGHVDVDALEGRVQAEKLQTPNPDVYIMD